jgi:hypothetical protein
VAEQRVDLFELYQLIAGEGRYAHLGSGLRTYPSDPDPNQAALHRACVRLEQYGHVRQRRIEDEGSTVLWEVVPPQPGCSCVKLSPPRGEGSPTERGTA